MMVIMADSSEYQHTPNPNPLIVRIRAYMINSAEDAMPERDYVANLSNPKRVHWMNDFIRWACHNGMFVEIENDKSAL
jgi:hypothetical protein